MKYLGSVIIAFTFIALISSFYVKFGTGNEEAVISTSGFMKHLETFPRENFNNLIELIEDTDEIANVINNTIIDFDGVEDVLNVIGNFIYTIWLIIRTVFLFIYYSFSYAGDIMIWILKLPSYLILYIT